MTDTKALWLADVLTDAGLSIKPLAGWEQRGGLLDPGDGANGVMWHHTVTKPSRPDADVDRFLGITGRKDLPAPLCNISTNRDGSVSIIAAGKANHGGLGSWLNISGNANWIGDEMKNLGPTEPWPKKQIECATIAAAAILTELGRGAGWLCAHKEYADPPGRKTDPHTLNMDTMRRNVAAILEAEPMGLPITRTSNVEDIRRLQKLLAQGFKVKLTVTGVYDPPTAAAVKANLLRFTGADEADGPNTDMDNGYVVNGLMMVGLETTAFKTGAGLSEADVLAIINDRTIVSAS